MLLDDGFLVFFNAWWEPLDFVIPTRDGQAWRAEIDSHDPAAAASAGSVTPAIASPSAPGR